jgi:hypothetical protein
MAKVHRRHPMTRRQRDNLIVSGADKCIVGNK